jgi:PKD repeat protein
LRRRPKVKRGVRETLTRTLILFSCVVGMSVLVLALASCALFNKFPTAGFTIGPGTTGPAPFAVTLSGEPSSDPDGEIKSYSWDYGDGAVGTGKLVEHTYTAVGTYTIILTVTDNWDAADRAAKAVYVTAAEPAGPTASFTMSPSSGTSPLNVALDASASSYAAGTITAYEWTFGDGGNGFGRTTAHTFFSSGSQTFTVALLVRASDGKTGTVSKTVSVSATGGGGTTPAGSPSARFDIQTDSLGVAPLKVVFDPSDSEAAEGRTLILYTWSFGDGDATSDIGASTKQHVFTTDATSKVFSVTLLVLDNEGDSDSITKTVKAYNHRPVAGFETANPPGGHGTGLVQFANAGEIAEGDWEADNVVYGNLGIAATTVKVWIRSKAIPDPRWFNLDGSLDQGALRTSTTSAVSSTAPSVPTGYSNHNYSYDPEGQTWAGARPAWFPNQAWGIRYLYISWGDDSALQRVDYAAAGVVLSHDYAFTASGTLRTISVTAEDWLGYESAPFSRTVTMKAGVEGANDL